MSEIGRTVNNIEHSSENVVFDEKYEKLMNENLE